MENKQNEIKENIEVMRICNDGKVYLGGILIPNEVVEKIIMSMSFEQIKNHFENTYGTK